MAISKARNPGQVGCWVSDQNGRRLFFISVDGLANSAGVLDTILEVSRQSLYFDGAIGILVRKFDSLLRLRENFCRDGVDQGDKSLEEIISIVEDSGKIVAGRR